ncbi:hypothetical protein BH10ACT1_BH10ACT1_15370 [soil metagenome]
MTDRPPRPSRPIAPDRVGLPTWLLPALVLAVGVELAVAGQSWMAHRHVSLLPGVVGGFALGALAVVGLRSLSLRLVSRIMVVVGGAALVRFGSFDGSLLVGSQAVLVWVVAAVAVFVLSDRVATGAQPGLLEPDSSSPGAIGADAPKAAPGAPPLASPAGRPAPGSTFRTLVLVGAAVVLVAVVLTPVALPHLADSTAPGEGPRLNESDGAGASLRSTDSLDMTRRPELTDEVLFTVATNRPTFWRGETFDRWDGRRWTRSQPNRQAVESDGKVVAFPDDLGAAGPEEFQQTVRIEAEYSDVLFAAPSAVQVDNPGPVAQRADGTLSTVGAALGQGATYSVTSRRPALTEARLRAVEGGAIPSDVLAQYAAAPVTTDRVRQAATRVTAGADTTYDKIIALEEWMGSRTEYSLDAPLSPEGVDVVDHFLFTSKQGWCEQVASSLVVMARANGVPARLVTGFVPEDRDRVTGTYLVRARDAHAWAEVWFPELGWVPFDPTADVPLAATVSDDSTVGQWLLDHALFLALGVALVAAVAGPAFVLARRWRRRRHDRPVGWPATADARLVALGARVGRPRSPSETATAYAEVLAVRYREPRLADVGRVIDDALFAPTSPDAGRTADADRLLQELADADPPPADPSSVDPPPGRPPPGEPAEVLAQ